VILLPQMLKAWVAALEAGAAPPVDLRFAAVGGGRVAPELIGRARRLGLPVFEGYGLSECASVVSLNTPAADRPGSVGRVLPHVRVELAADGEILIAGNTFLGYLGAGAPPPARLATGDLGRLDAEGFLHVTGRKKNVIITSFGRNVSPEWPEAELAARPQIAQAAVFGEARPCCVAVLVPAEPGLADADLQRAVDAANRALPDYARIGAWVRAGAPFSAAAGTATANGRLRRDAIWEIHGAALAELDPASGEPA
jgi:long-subunit acyl-CoA synthetase (AMP-forming)